MKKNIYLTIFMLLTTALKGQTSLTFNQVNNVTGEIYSTFPTFSSTGCNCGSKLDSLITLRDTITPPANKIWKIESVYFDSTSVTSKGVTYNSNSYPNCQINSSIYSTSVYLFINGTHIQDFSRFPVWIDSDDTIIIQISSNTMSNRCVSTSGSGKKFGLSYFFSILEFSNI
jgi:hypothetical protein